MSQFRTNQAYKPVRVLLHTTLSVSDPAFMINMCPEMRPRYDLEQPLAMALYGLLFGLDIVVN